LDQLDTGPERLLDAVEVVARNVFYHALAPSKAAYDNHRDDHEHLGDQSPIRWSPRGPVPELQDATAPFILPRKLHSIPVCSDEHHCITAGNKLGELRETAGMEAANV
jgi:hypothetical protein